MTKNFPEIITELINTGEAKRLHDFYHLEDAFEQTDQSMHFFSVYLAKETLADELRRDEKYMTKKEQVRPSMVDQETMFYWRKRSEEHFRLIDERMDQHKKSPEYSHIEEWDYMDESRLKDRVLEELNEEIKPRIIEKIKNEYQEMYGDKWEEAWEKLDLFSSGTEYKYERRHDMPRPFNDWDYYRGIWQQFYLARDREGNFHYQTGGSTSSSRRFIHSIYGHLFAMLDKIKPIPTYFLVYDRYNQFLFYGEENRLWLEFMDLRTNCSVNDQESKKILSDVPDVRDHELFDKIKMYSF